MSIITASTPSTKITDEQVGKLFDQLRPHIRKSGITGEAFQKMLMQEKELKIRSRVIALLAQIASEVADSFVISVNYDEADAIVHAIEAGSFAYKSVDVDSADIPLAGTGEAEHEVFEIHLGHVVYSRDLPAELDSRNVTFANPLTALRYAVKLPDRQRKYPLGILFNNKQGQLRYLILSEDDGGRSLSVNRGSPDGHWDGRCRFLAVHKSRPLES